MPEPQAQSRQSEGCPCGHKPTFCHRENAAKWCPADTQAEAAARQVETLLNLSRVPTESYEAQGGGMCEWTLAGRVDHLLRLLDRHGVSVDEGVRKGPS